MNSVATDWRQVGGIFGSHHTYERFVEGGRLRAYVRGDGEGAPRVAKIVIEADPVSANLLRQADMSALEVTIEAETLGEGRRYLAEWCGISPRERLRRSRGRPEQWSDEDLCDLVEVVRARQAAGRVATDLSDVAPWHLSCRRVRELLAKAARRGLVTIKRAPGQSNLYGAPEVGPE